MARATQPLSRSIEQFIAAESRPEAIDNWVEQIAGPVVAQIPQVAEDAVLAQTVRVAVRDHWLAFMGSLREPARPLPLVEAAADFAAELARRGHPLLILFRTYRLGQQQVWRYFTAAVEEMSDGTLDEREFLVFMWGRASDFLDVANEASTEVYQAERTRIESGVAAASLDAVRALLSGERTDAGDLSTALGGHPVSGYNTALILHAQNVDRIPDLREAVTRLAQAVRTRNPLLISPGGRHLWAWLSTRSAPEVRHLQASAPWLTERGITVAVGTPLDGLDGFRQSHLEAQQAQDLVFRARQTPTITLFPEVELLSLLASVPEAAQRFTTRTLGGLADDAEGPTRLRQTLHALLSTGSVDEASRALTVHKNTVRYRVNQAEALLGSPKHWSTTEVELAIRYYDTFISTAG